MLLIKKLEYQSMKLHLGYIFESKLYKNVQNMSLIIIFV